jgi:NDP-sugar pyrophosphorylase family protein
MSTTVCRTYATPAPTDATGPSGVHPPPSRMDDAQLTHMSTEALYARLVGGAKGPPMTDVSAIVLAAGIGRRLSPLTDTTPKPLLPVLNLPILLWAMAHILRAGITNACANIWYRPQAFDLPMHICASHGPHLQVQLEPRLTGPLGGILSCLHSLPHTRDYVVVSGDTLPSVNLRSLVAAHRSRRAALTVTTTTTRMPSRYGVLSIDDNANVTGMVEKPGVARPVEYINCGTYVIARDALLSLTEGPRTRPRGFAELISALIGTGASILAYPLVDWIDVGAPRDLLDANLRYLHSPNLAMVAARHFFKDTGELWTQGPVPVPDATSVYGRVLVGHEACIGNRVRLTNTVVGHFARIESNVDLRNSIVLPYAVVGSDCREDGQVITPL